MFEGSLVESRGLVVSRAQRWSAVGSATLQLMLAALIVVIPLMRPQTLKIFTQAPHLTVPPLPVRPPVAVRMVTSNPSSVGPSAPSTPTQTFSGPTIVPRDPGMPSEDIPAPIGQISLGQSNTMPSLGTGNGPAVTVAHATQNGPINISRGVSEGMLLAPIRPEYPQIARAIHVQGTVVVEAGIAKTGKIESAHAVSGPAMLQQAAVDAVAAARYRPYLLSGEPVEVQTTVTVVFRLGE
jgi:protein TonB